MTIKPGFITGANAQIKIDNAIIAFATDVAYNITVQTIPVESFGKYEVHSNEPVAYTVDGSFSIIRYTKRAKEHNITDTVTPGNHAHETGSAGQNIGKQVSPAQILSSNTFALDIFEKGHANGVKQFFKIQDCRITRRGATLNKRGILVDNYSFVGILAGDIVDDKVTYGPSGDLDHAITTSTPEASSSTND